MEAEFEKHVEETYKGVYYFAMSLAKNEADAADLTQQAYLKLAKNWAKIRDRSKVKSWLFSALYREFLDRRKRSRFNSDVSFEIVAAELEDESLPSNKVDHETMLIALRELDETLRLPLTLFYLEDYSYRQIAEILLIPIGTVMSRMHRGKETLYKVLTKAPNTPELSYS